MNKPTFNSKIAATPEDFNQYDEYSSMTPEQMGEAGFYSEEAQERVRPSKAKEKPSTTRKTPLPGDITVYSAEPITYKPKLQKGQKFRNVVDPEEYKPFESEASEYHSNLHKMAALLKVPVLTMISQFPCPTCKGKMHGGFEEAPVNKPHEQLECITCGNKGFHLPKEHADLLDNMSDVSMENRKHNENVQWHEDNCLAHDCADGCPINRAILRHRLNRKDEDGNLIKGCHPSEFCTDNQCMHHEEKINGQRMHCAKDCDHVLGQGNLDEEGGGPLGPADQARANFLEKRKKNCTKCDGNGCRECSSPKIPRGVAFSRAGSSTSTVSFAARRATVGEKDNIAPMLQIMGGHPRQGIRRGTPIYKIGGWDNTNPNAALYSDLPQEDYMLRHHTDGAVHVPGMPTENNYEGGINDPKFHEDYGKWKNVVDEANAKSYQESFYKAPHRQREMRDETANAGGYQGKHTFGVITNVSHDGQYVEGVEWGASAEDDRNALRDQIKGTYGYRRQTRRTSGDTVNKSWKSKRDRIVRKPVQDHIANAMDELQPMIGEKTTSRRVTAVPFACHVSQVGRVDTVNSQFLQTVGDVQTTMFRRDVDPSHRDNPDANQDQKIQAVVHHLKPTLLSTEGYKHLMYTTPNNEARRRMYGLAEEAHAVYGVPLNHKHSLIPREMHGVLAGHVSINNRNDFDEASPSTLAYQAAIKSPGLNLPTSQMPGRLKGGVPEISDEDAQRMADTVNKKHFREKKRNLSKNELEDVHDAIKSEGHINGGLRAAGFDPDDEEE